jgi:hypothetical protein
MPIDPDKLHDIQAQCLEGIKDIGWFIMSVFPTQRGDGPSWSYSTGLFHRFHHPEIVVFGESNSLQQSMINAIGVRVRAGEAFRPGPAYADILGGGHYVSFRAMHVAHYKEWLNLACWFYNRVNVSFPVLQCFYPDMNGKFPWEPGCETWAVESQPLLYKPKEVNKVN